ncbi:MAG: hypothetical protein HQL84_17195 [Magnetococcales bacterium]|nr:hypothetical protein [Magnetococcales bacterium]MBF0151757.1 hypothetical protein [Magnetococcales bacterium]
MRHRIRNPKAPSERGAKSVIVHQAGGSSHLGMVDGKLKVVGMGKDHPGRSLAGQTRPILGMAISTDEKHLHVCDGSTLRSLNLQHGKPERTINLEKSAWIQFLDADGSLIASRAEGFYGRDSNNKFLYSSAKEELLFLTTEDGQETHTIRESITRSPDNIRHMSETYIRALTRKPNSSVVLLAIGNDIRLWDDRLRGWLGYLDKGMASPAVALSCSRSGDRLYACCMNGTIRRYELFRNDNHGRMECEWRQHAPHTNTLLVGNGGEIFYGSIKDRRVVIEDVPGKIENRKTLNIGEPVHCLAQSSDGKRLYVGGLESVSIWDWERLRLMGRMYLLSEGYLWSTCPEGQEKNGWIFTNRPELVEVYQEDHLGIEYHEVSAETRQARLRDYNRWDNVFHAIWKPERQRKSYVPPASIPLSLLIGHQG